jgi:hypothetical protein
MIEAISSSETSALTRATRRNIAADGILFHYNTLTGHVKAFSISYQHSFQPINIFTLMAYLMM